MDNDLLFRHAPPVRIGLRMAAINNRQLVREAAISGQGNRFYVDAGNYGMREPRFGSVPIMVRFARTRFLQGDMALRSVKPINFTRKKRGFPLPELPSERASAAPTPASSVARGSARNRGLP